MDYTARYGLEFNPFLKNSKEVLVETEEYKEELEQNSPFMQFTPVKDDTLPF